MFDTNELAMIWFALVLEQKEYEEGSKNWWRRERLIRKVEKELGMSERPFVKEVRDES
jgi:coenzyme F420-reducing hydrogenase delta subunit